MRQLSEAIDNIRKEYYTFEEFPTLPRERFPIGMISVVQTLPENQVRSYALSLRSEELEGLLLDVITISDPSLVEKVAHVISYRLSHRLVTLISNLCQYHFDKAQVSQLCREIRKNCSDFFVKNESFLARFGGSSNKVDDITQAFLERGGSLKENCVYFSVLTQSPLAGELFIRYFSQCDKLSFLQNLDILKDLIHISEITHLLEPLSNYLAVLNLIEYDDSVNLLIAEKFGQPYLSIDWEPFAVELREKYAHWNYLHRLKIHCEQNPKKYHLLVKYFEHVRSNYVIEESEVQVLVMDFGWIVLVDDKNSPNAYLYRRDQFEREMAEWEADKEKRPTFLNPMRGVLTAREYMLSIKDAPCIQLTFQDIHYFYIDEVLEIKLGIEPDIRKQRLQKK